MCPIQVVRKPTGLTIFPSDVLSNRDKETAQEAPYAKNAEVERKTYTFQLDWHLIVEELLQTNHGEYIGNTKEYILRY